MNYFNLAAKERIHAVGLVLPSFMHSVNDQIDADIKLVGLREVLSGAPERDKKQLSKPMKFVF
jgi:hypothetical protein